MQWFAQRGSRAAAVAVCFGLFALIAFIIDPIGVSSSAARMPRMVATGTPPLAFESKWDTRDDFAQSSDAGSAITFATLAQQGV